MFSQKAITTAAIPTPAYEKTYVYLIFLVRYRYQPTFKNRADFEHSHPANTHQLAPWGFENEKGSSTEDHGNHVGNQKRTAAVLVAQIGEAPHVSKANGLNSIAFRNQNVQKKIEAKKLTYPTHDIMKSAQELQQ